MNIESLITLAVGSQPDATEKEFGILPNDTGTNAEIKAALKEMADGERKAVIKEAATAICKLNKDVKDEQTRLVAIIRDSRANELRAKRQLAQIKEATEIANIKSNYLPLAIAAGYNIPLMTIFKHPDLFDPKGTAKKTSAAPKAK